jgi:hypothetical protein
MPLDRRIGALERAGVDTARYAGEVAEAAASEVTALKAEVAELQAEIARLKNANKKAGNSVIDLPSMRVAQ